MKSSAKETVSDQRTAVQILADWALAIGNDDVPASCMTQAKLLLLDSIGCAIAAKQEDVCRGVLAFCNDIGGTGPCTIIGESSGRQTWSMRSLPMERW